MHDPARHGARAHSRADRALPRGATRARGVPSADRAGRILACRVARNLLHPCTPLAREPRQMAGRFAVRVPTRRARRRPTPDLHEQGYIRQRRCGQCLRSKSYRKHAAGESMGWRGRWCRQQARRHRFGRGWRWRRFRLCRNQCHAWREPIALHRWWRSDWWIKRWRRGWRGLFRGLSSRCRVGCSWRWRRWRIRIRKFDRSWRQWGGCWWHNWRSGSRWRNVVRYMWWWKRWHTVDWWCWRHYVCRHQWCWRLVACGRCGS